MSYSEILAAYEAEEVEPICALELANCGTIMELYELAAEEDERFQLLSSAGLLRHVSCAVLSA